MTTILWDGGNVLLRIESSHNKISRMVKIKVTYNAKPKETKELEASDFNELKKQIY